MQRKVNSRATLFQKTAFPRRRRGLQPQPLIQFGLHSCSVCTAQTGRTSSLPLPSPASKHRKVMQARAATSSKQKPSPLDKEGLVAPSARVASRNMPVGREGRLLRKPPLRAPLPRAGSIGQATCSLISGPRVYQRSHTQRKARDKGPARGGSTRHAPHRGGRRLPRNNTATETVPGKRRSSCQATPTISS